MNPEVESLVRFHGEEYRRLIVDALAWLDAREPTWGLSECMNRSDVVAELVLAAKGIRH